MTKERRKHSAEDKVLILKRHLVERVAVSDLCDEYGLNPNVFYRWQKEFFENGAAAFEKKRNGSAPAAKEREKIARLEARLAHKDEVIAEIMADHVRLKKKASLKEFVGEIGFGQISKCMIESDFQHSEGLETVRFSGGQFRFAVQTLHHAAGKLLFRPKPVQD